MKEQSINIGSAEEYLDSELKKYNADRVMLVCDSSLPFLYLSDYIHSKKFTEFSDFTPNPLYEQVEKGVDLFNENRCDCIVAIGGGSTLDVAKCIKLYSKMNRKDIYINQEYKDTGVPVIAIPTTAGTGSDPQDMP